MVKLPELFARTSTGATQVWEIQIEDDKYRTAYGQVDGKQTTTSWTYAKPTNEGRANERDVYAQARFEAEAMWKKKKESGYHETLGDIDKQVFIEPMLAKKYEDYKEDLKFPVFSQPKLDGCLHEDTLVLTRSGNKKIKNMIAGDEVLTYNLHTSAGEWKNVTAVMKNGVDRREPAKKQWYKVTTENGGQLILTGNHRVWVNNLRCWRRADELDGSEDLKTD